MTDFIAQLGNATQPGLLSLDERLATLTANQNPYITGASLAANSPLFFGRQRELHEILSVLRRPDKPSSVSVLGERRIGKSSLLNQIFQALAKEEKLIALFATAQNFAQLTEPTFFRSLKLSILQALNLALAENEAVNYEQFRDFVLELAKQGYRFVILIDEFEKLSGNPAFTPTFFGNLRALGERSEFRLGYVISSRHALKDLCRNHKIDESSFWNIFGSQKIIGLLTEKEAYDLWLKPILKTLPNRFAEPVLLEKWGKAKILSGCHPLFVQIIACDYWNAWNGDFTVDSIALKMNLRQFMEDLFYQRSQENQAEWEVLLKAAAGKTLEQNYVFNELYLRGLILKDGKTFNPYFAEVIKEECKTVNGKSIEVILDEVEKGLEIGVDKMSSYFELFLKGAELAGKVRKVFLAPNVD